MKFPGRSDRIVSAFAQRLPKGRGPPPDGGGGGEGEGRALTRAHREDPKRVWGGGG